MKKHAHVGQAIALMRGQHDLTQQQLAARAGISAHVISTFERGCFDPRFDSLDRIASAFGMPLWELIRFADRLRDTIDTRQEDAPLLPAANWRAA